MRTGLHFPVAAFAWAVAWTVCAALPRVGLTDQRLHAGWTTVESPYAEAFEKAGFVPCVIPCTTNAVALESALAGVDMLVVTGGADVDPARYGAKRVAACGPSDAVRDAFEFAAIAAARRRRLPIVGICRGMQLVNVAFGGTLWQDLPSEWRGATNVNHGVGSYLRPRDFPAAHLVRPEPGTRLAAAIGTEPLAVNSHHHQAVRDLAPGFRVAARAPDGVIEAIEGLDYPAFGVQSHPESLVARAEGHPGYDHPRLLRLFRELGSLAGVPAEAAADRTAWFREARFGLFVHWGIYSMPPARGEWAYTRADCDRAAYRARAKRFNPTAYDPSEWARLAKAAGMKYIVFTTRHHDGFCMFDSHFTDYKITKSPYGKDAVRMMVEAFRKEGLRVGFYHSLPDWNHPGYVDPETPEAINGRPKRPATPEEHRALKDLIYNHIRQLMTEYGRIDLLFTDYTSKYKANEDYFDRERILKMVYACQPDIIVNDRLAYYKDNCRDFDYYTPEICVPNQPQQVKGREVPWETCATMNDNWGYSDEDRNFKSVEALVAGLVGCVSRNGNLLLNVGPDSLGRFPAESVARLKGIADWYGANGESVTGCGKSEYRPPYGCVYTQKGRALYCHFLQVPLGDTILPQLKGKVAKATLLRTGEAVKLVDEWGFELLKPDEQRIRTRNLRVGDVVRIELNLL